MKIILILIFMLNGISFAKDNCEKLFWRTFYVDNILAEAGERSGLEVDEFSTFLANADKSQIRSFNKALKTMRKQRNYKKWQGDRAFDKIYDLVYGKAGKTKSWVQNLKAKGLLDEVKPDAEQLVVKYITKRILKKNITEILDELDMFTGKPVFRKRFQGFYYKYRQKFVAALDSSLEVGFLLADGAFPIIPRLKFLDWKKVDHVFIKEIEELISKEGIDAVMPKLLKKYGKTAQVDIVYNRIRRVYNSYALPLLFGTMGYGIYETIKAQMLMREMQQEQAEELINGLLEMETKLIEESDSMFFSMMSDLSEVMGEIDVYQEDYLKMRVVQATVYIKSYFYKNPEGKKLVSREEFFKESESKENEANLLYDKFITHYEAEIIASGDDPESLLGVQKKQMIRDLVSQYYLEE